MRAKYPVKMVKLFFSRSLYYRLKLADKINLKELATSLYNEHSIWLGRANENGIIKFTVNESILLRDIDEIVEAWKLSMK